eukprot:CAMPEP_0178422308 /NCGR_PEP_ID=MMETSP0689_2-20121128/27104_1 /TAXON_ID=160604 /ORGANISM="Amphidinium massartii, Strain CS-259" /LENGTH=32 /DNA_ID= /DNA_START= /DNA_END= /DNA_ORIENTATION=
MSIESDKKSNSSSQAEEATEHGDAASLASSDL